MTLTLKFVLLLVAWSVMTGVQANKASAEVITNQWQQFVTFQVNACNGEFVPVLSGLAHVVQRLQPDGSLITSTNGHFVAVALSGTSTSSTGRSDSFQRQGKRRLPVANSS